MQLVHYFTFFHLFVKSFVFLWRTNAYKNIGGWERLAVKDSRIAAVFLSILYFVSKKPPWEELYR